jgi:hypothetical protein
MGRPRPAAVDSRATKPFSINRVNRCRTAVAVTPVNSTKSPIVATDRRRRKSTIVRSESSVMSFIAGQNLRKSLNRQLNSTGLVN